VVNHKNPDEAESFRSLLSYLLAPMPPMPSHSRASSMSSRTSKPDTSPPRKRTRSNTPVGSWTNTLDVDEIMGDPAPSTPPSAAKAKRTSQELLVNVHMLQEEEDAEELKMRDGMAAAVSGARFAQRNEVFEELLKFIAEENKQPSGNLLDLVDRANEG
jgi:muskelin